MAAISTQAEYDLVREALQAFTTDTTRQVYSGSIGDLNFTFSTAQIPQLQAREEVLARRLSARNARKRVTPDFSGSGNDGFVA